MELSALVLVNLKGGGGREKIKDEIQEQMRKILTDDKNVHKLLSIDETRSLSVFTGKYKQVIF